MPRAALIPAPGAPLEIHVYPEPTPMPGETVLKTLASEVCGTDVHLWHGKLPGVPYPLIPGHVSVGTVHATTAPLSDIDGNPIATGDTVTFLDVHGTCYHCRTCLVDKTPTKCPSRRVYGITLGADDGLHGGWSERIVLRPGTHILPLPKSVPAERWIAAGCGLPTATHAIERADVTIASRVLILGAGPVGLAAAALALAQGSQWVGIVDPVEQRRQTALRLGVDQSFAPAGITSYALAANCGGNGPDIVIEASGNPDAVGLAFELVRNGGQVIVVGQYTDNGAFALNPHTHLNRKHIRTEGCWGVEFAHFQRALDFLARTKDRFPWESAVGKRYKLQDAETALRDVEARRLVKALIVPD